MDGRPAKWRACRRGLWFDGDSEGRSVLQPKDPTRVACVSGTSEIAAAFGVDEPTAVRSNTIAQSLAVFGAPPIVIIGFHDGRIEHRPGHRHSNAQGGHQQLSDGAGLEGAKSCEHFEMYLVTASVRAAPLEERRER